MVLDNKKFRLICNKCPTDGKQQSNQIVMNQISNNMRIAQVIKASSQNRRLACLPAGFNSRVQYVKLPLNMFGRLDTPGGISDLGQPVNGGTPGGCAAKGGSLPIKNF